MSGIKRLMARAKPGRLGSAGAITRYSPGWNGSLSESPPSIATPVHTMDKALCGPTILLISASLAPRTVLAGRASEMRVEAFELLSEGVAAYNRGDYPGAVEKLRRATSIALNSFRAHYYLGLALNASRRYEEALETLGVALDSMYFFTFIYPTS